MTNDELIKIAAKALADHGSAQSELLKECNDLMMWISEPRAAAVIAALRAAGAISAEGTVVIDATRWEDTSDLADALCQWVDGIRYAKQEAAAEHLTADGMLSWDDVSYAVDEFRASYVGDRDAVPAREDAP